MTLTSLDQAKNDQLRQYTLEINLDFELFSGVDKPSQGTTEQLTAIMELFPSCVGVFYECSVVTSVELAARVNSEGAMATPWCLRCLKAEQFDER